MIMTTMTKTMLNISMIMMITKMIMTTMTSTRGMMITTTIKMIMMTTIIMEKMILMLGLTPKTQSRGWSS